VNASGPAADWILERLAAADLPALESRYAVDVLLDVTRPAWRLQLRGRRAAAEFLAEEQRDRRNARTTWLRATPAADAIVAEYETRWDGPDGEHLTRTVSVLRIAGDEIVEHSDYGCGTWTPERFERNQAQAPIIHW
jgi:predicted SnoaL-like aldol condensation-catalyzing enzyme